MIVGRGPSRAASYPGGVYSVAFKSTPSARLYRKICFGGSTSAGCGCGKSVMRLVVSASPLAPSSKDDLHAAGVADDRPRALERTLAPALPQSSRRPRVYVVEVQERLVPSVARALAGEDERHPRLPLYGPWSHSDVALHLLELRGLPPVRGERAGHLREQVRSVRHPSRHRRARIVVRVLVVAIEQQPRRAVRTLERVHDPRAQRAGLVPRLVQQTEPVRAPGYSAVAQIRLKRRHPRGVRVFVHVCRVRDVPRRCVYPRISPVLRFRPVQLRGLVRAPVDGSRALAHGVVHDRYFICERQRAHLANGLPRAVYDPRPLRESSARDLVRERTLNRGDDHVLPVRRRFAPRVNRALARERRRLSRADGDFHELGRAKVFEQVRVVRVLEEVRVRSRLRDIPAGVRLHPRTARRRRLLRPPSPSFWDDASDDRVRVEPGITLEQRVQPAAG
eukprot:30294-Pelagococcus_subviridis.AAC.21